MKRRRIIAALAAIAVAVCLISCSGKGSAKGSEKSAGSGSAGSSAAGESGSGAAKAVDAKIVKSQAVETKTLRPYVDRGGDVEASVEVLVYPDIGGKLVNLNVVLGDRVTKFQAIASVNPSKPGTNYEISPVVSPIAGTVTSVLVDPGTTVTTSTAIIKVGILDELKIVMELPERDSAKVKEGMSANVSLVALPGESLKATVSRVSPVLDSTSRTREITLKFLSRDRRVASGMYASVKISISPLADRVVIPVAAVITRSDETYVFIVSSADGGTVAKKIAVKIGTEVDGEVEVVSGLKAGDKVVVEGQDQLSEGDKVEEKSDKVEEKSGSGK